MYRRNFGSSVDAGSSDEDDNAVSASGLPPTPASAPPMSFSPPATPSGSDGVSSSTSALSASVVEDIYSQGGPPSASGGGGVDSTSDIVSHRSFSSYRDVADESGYDADSSSQAAHPRRDSPSHPPGDSPLVTSSQIPESPFPPPESPNPSTAGSSRPGQSSNDGAEVAASPSLSSGSPPSAIHPRSDESPADSSPPQQARKRRRSSADEGEATAREAVASEAPPLRRRHLCFNCNIAFLSENSLRRHVRVAHPAPDGEEGDQGESASPSEPSSSAELNPPPDQPSVAAGEPSSSSSGSPSHEEHPPDGGNNPPASNNGLQPPNSSTTSSSLHSMHRPYHPHILGNPFLPKVEINPFPCAAMEFLGFNPPPNNPSGASATFLHPPPFALLHHQQPQYNQPIHSQNVPRRRLPYPQQENSSQTTASPSQLRKRLTSGGSRTQRPNPNSANSGILPTILNRAPRMNSSRPGTVIRSLLSAPPAITVTNVDPAVAPAQRRRLPTPNQGRQASSAQPADSSSSAVIRELLARPAPINILPLTAAPIPDPQAGGSRSSFTAENAQSLSSTPSNTENPILAELMKRLEWKERQQRNSSSQASSSSRMQLPLGQSVSIAPIPGGITPQSAPLPVSAALLPSRTISPRMAPSTSFQLPSRQEPTVVVEQRSSHPSEKQHQNNLPSSEATPNLPSSTATPNVPSSAATPNLPSSAATPNLPSSAATPNVPSSAATPNVPSSAVTPNVPSSAATPNLPSSAATPNSGSASTSTPSRSATASCSGANGVSAHWIASTRNAMEQPLGPSVTVSHSTDTAHCSSVLEMVPQSCGSSLRLNMSAGPKDILLPSAQLIDRPVRRSPVEITDEFNDTVSSDVKLTSAEILDPLVEDVASVSPEPGAQPLVPVINGVLTSGSKKSSESSCSAASPQLHKCDHCGQSFKSIPALKAHMKTHSDVKYDCPICSAVFPTMRDLRHHVPSHKTNDGFYVCFQCGIRRPLYAQIRKHVRAYHSDLSYTCPICHRQFSHRNKLRNHLTSHSHDRQFLCSNCGQQFKRKDKLKEHFAKKHGPKIVSKVKRKQLNPGNNMPFRCDHCNAGFRRRGMLVNHVVQHHPSVPREMFSALATPITKPVTVFPCPHCDRKYQSSSKRKSHCLKAHPGKAVPLGIQRRNPDGNNEKDGEKCFVVMPPEILNGTGTIEKPARCVLCHKEYANKNKLIGHMRKAHKPTEEEGGIWLKTASNGTTKQEASDLGPSATMLFSPHMNPRENNEPNTSIKVETVVLPPGFNHRQHIDLGLKSASNGAAKQEASDLRPSATVLPSPHMSPGENNEPNTSIKVETVVLPPGFSYRRHIDLGPHEKKTKTPEQLSRLSENNGDCDNDGTTASGEKNTPQSEGVFIGPSTSSSGDAAPPSEANSSSFLPQFLCAPETPEVVPHEIDGLLLSPPPVLPPPQARVSAHSLLPSPSPSRDIQSLGPVTMNHHAAGGL